MANTEAAQAVEPVLDAASEAILEGVDGVVETMEVVRTNPIALVTVGVLGLAAGGAAGYFLAKKRLREFYEDLANSEIEESRRFYAQVNKTDPSGAVLTPMDVMAERHGEEAAAEAVRTYQGRRTVQDLVESGELTPDEEGLVEVEPGILVDAQDEMQIEKIEKARIQSISLDKEVGPGGGKIEEVREVEKTRAINVFRDDTFDLEEEIKFRTEDAPYIITHDEYFAAEKEYEQVSLTYFEGDGTLADETDRPVDDIEHTVGDQHLVRFGSGSKDKNIVYIRNDKLQIDYEVIRSKGTFLEEVLGMNEPDELKHSAERDRRREFRRHGDG